MQEKSEYGDRNQLVDGNKVDWKGRSALKFKYGGMKAAFLILSKYFLTKIYIHIYKRNQIITR